MRERVGGGRVGERGIDRSPHTLMVRAAAHWPSTSSTWSSVSSSLPSACVILTMLERSYTGAVSICERGLCGAGRAAECGGSRGRACLVEAASMLLSRVAGVLVLRPVVVPAAA